MTPAATIELTEPRTTPHHRGYPGFDLSFSRSSDSTAGAIAEGDRAVPRRVRLIIRAGLRYWGLSGLTESAELLATELVTNAFKHGRGDVGVRLYITASHLLIEVRDGSAERPVSGRADLDDEDGRGLLLVSSIADHWGVSSDGTTTWCSLPF